MMRCYINVRLKAGNEASLVYRTKNVSAETQQNRVIEITQSTVVVWCLTVTTLWLLEMSTSSFSSPSVKCAAFNSLVDRFLSQITCNVSLSSVNDLGLDGALCDMPPTWHPSHSSLWGLGQANLEATDRFWWIRGSWAEAIPVRRMPYMLAHCLVQSINQSSLLFQ